jgi:energy-coupling factor transporter ATP-binding protein EcfA2
MKEEKNIYKTSQVFTPTTPARNSFVERNSKLNNHLVDALQTPGKQIVLYGHSGCGKTTLLLNKLSQVYEKKYITRCMAGMNFESILLDGFDQLSQTYNDQVSSSKGFKISPEINISYQDIKASLKLGEYVKQKSEQQKQVLPPQLTPQRLARFFGASNSCWILEDFHKITGDDKIKTSQLMKVFMDMSEEYPDLKIIALGAVGTARNVVTYDREMNNRVAEIFIPYMDSKEIEKIINTGEQLLNLFFSKDVKSKIVKYSCGLPSICHQLCLNICFNKRIFETPKDKISINLEDLDESIEKFVEEKSDSFKSEFDKAIKVGKNIKINVPKMILELCLQLNKDELSHSELFSLAKRYYITENHFTQYLAELCTPERSEILVYDENSNLYRFSNLFLKAYTFLRLKENKKKLVADEDDESQTSKETKMINKLLEIIENDVYDLIEDDYLYDEEF